MSRGMTRAERLREMERLYVQRAFTDIEMAERLHVVRETVFKDRRLLETQVPFIEVEPGRWKIDRTRYLSEIRVNLHEALALYLAARRASQQTRISQPHFASALEKLAASLRQPMTAHLVRAAGAILEQATQSERVQVLETIAEAWVRGLKVRIVHRALHAEQARPYIVSPYVIEPSPWSDGTYLIGESDVHGKVATFKIERIERAALTSDGFDIPGDFDEQELLKHAWGIWYGDRKPETVRLRFRSEPAIRRLKESIWHPLEEYEYPGDGSCIWSAPIAEPREMLPWVRGWGADCEVVGPDKLRNALQWEASRLARLYLGNGAPAAAPHFYLWAKTDRKTGQWHPLLYHLIDVGQVALALWEKALAAGIRQQISAWLQLTPEDAGRLIAFWVSLHDLGKASPAFQDHPSLPDALKAALLAPLKNAQYVFPVRGGEKRARHEVISAWALETLLVSEAGYERRAARQVARALGGHHGTWPTAGQLSPVSLKSDDKGGETWEAARRALLQEMKKVFNPPENVSLPDEQLSENALLTLFSGLTTVADWIGSMESFFPYEEMQLSSQEYAQRAAGYAGEALESLGWLGWQASGDVLGFGEMFDFIAEPNAVQAKVIEVAGKLSPPGLVILEAPTGSGKTESALYLADRWLQSVAGQGLYVAMPTQATSNQMLQRVTGFLGSRYPNERINLHLIHGQARFTEDMQQLEMNAVAADRDDEGAGRVAAMTWFLPRKRTLLAPFGVGTVDQALMSVLQTRHFFVRLLGLSHKVVVFDEVHAYDTYMSTLFQRLLAWLRAVGTSVVILTATLPENTRSQLAAAYLGARQLDLPVAPYPRLTTVTEEGVQCIPVPATAGRTLALQWVGWPPEEIARYLKDALQDGGCAAVICNRVARAQDVYQAIRRSNVVDDESLILFHARFPFVWRDEIEKRVLSAFGKDGERPRKAIVVATQVIEQSLDLDFDLMISDLPPVDLLLQRAGRLQRHPQRDTARPARLAQPRLAITTPATSGGLPDFGRDSYVYEPYVLLQTWRALQGKERLHLPDETSALIEAVYTDVSVSEDVESTLADALQKSWEEMQTQQNTDEFKARTRLIRRPSDEDLLDEANLGLDEEDPYIHQAFRAMTRLIEPGVPLVCLHRTPAGLALEPDGQGAPLDMETKPSRDMVAEFAQRVVTIHRRDVLAHFQAQEPPKAWKDVAALRYHHLAVFENSRCPLQGTPIVLVLDRETGLEVQTGFQNLSGLMEAV